MLAMGRHHHRRAVIYHARTVVPRTPTQAASAAMASFAALLTLYGASANPNGLGRLPPLGWNTWCTSAACDQPNMPSMTAAGLHDNCSEALVKSVATEMISNGMRDSGYRHINLDDCWGATNLEGNRADVHRTNSPYETCGRHKISVPTPQVRADHLFSLNSLVYSKDSLVHFKHTARLQVSKRDWCNAEFSCTLAAHETKVLLLSTPG